MIPPAFLLTLIVTAAPGSDSTPRAAPLWPGATSVWDGAPASERYTAKCIVSKESLSAGLYRAENPISTASGVAQWIDSTWLAQARAARVRVTPHASTNPPVVQDRVFRWAIRYDLQAWRDSC